jgi:hypothetical protein
MSGFVTAGPFALCRNPLYIGSFLISIGYMLMCNSLIILALGIVIFWVLHGGAVLHEEGMLRKAFGEDFDSYCSRVPRFIPLPHKLSGEGSFSLRQANHNNEIRGAVFTLIFVSCFAAMAFGSFSIIGWLSRL